MIELLFLLLCWNQSWWGNGNFTQLMPSHPDISLMSYVARQIKKLNLFLSIFNWKGYPRALKSHICRGVFSVVVWTFPISWPCISLSPPFVRSPAEFLLAVTAEGLLFLSSPLLLPLITSAAIFSYPWLRCANSRCHSRLLSPAFSDYIRSSFLKRDPAQSPSKRFTTNNLSCRHQWGSEIPQETQAWTQLFWPWNAVLGSSIDWVLLIRVDLKTPFVQPPKKNTDIW